MCANVGNHFRLSGGGQAKDRRGSAVTRMFLHKPGDIPVIRPEIMAPLRYAMRFIQNPETDLSLSKDGTD